MPILRIIKRNLAADSTFKAASSTAVNTSVDALFTDEKTEVHRFANWTGYYSLRFATDTPITCVASTWCNLSPTGTVLIRGTTEQQATNLIRYSEERDNAVWTKSNSTVVANAGIAPDGTMTADKIVENTATNQHSTLQSVSFANLLPNTWYAWSCFYKAAGRNFIFASVGTFASQETTTSVYLNLLDGTLTGTGASRARAVQYPDGWWRLTVTIATNSAPGNVSPGSYLADSQNTNNYLGDGVSGVLVWGAQFEIRASNAIPASSYYPSGATASTRPKGYMDSWQNYEYSSGWVSANTAPAIKLRKFSEAASASAYQWGGGNKFQFWLPEKTFTGMTIGFNDPNNLQGYVELGQLIVGKHWSPETPHDYGGSITQDSMSTTTRSDSGTRHVEPGPKFDRISLSLNYMTAADRTELAALARENGMDSPMLISVFPEDADASLSRDHLMWGALTQSQQTTHAAFNRHSRTLELEAV